MAEFRAIAIARKAVGMMPAIIEHGTRIASGWFPKEEMARAELCYFMDQQLPAGCYQVHTIIEERR